MSNVTVAVGQPGEIARPLTEICKSLPISEAKLRELVRTGEIPSTGRFRYGAETKVRANLTLLGSFGAKIRPLGVWGDDLGMKFWVEFHSGIEEGLDHLPRLPTRHAHTIPAQSIQLTNRIRCLDRPDGYTIHSERVFADQAKPSIPDLDA